MRQRAVNIGLLGTIATVLEHPWNKTANFQGDFQQVTGGKAIESSRFLERAMGIEQIQSAKTKALLPAFQFNWSQILFYCLKMLTTA